MKKTEYVLGFMFSKNMEHITLINKNKPEWQKGFLNGIGGKIEPNEKPLIAMIREFAEETGVSTRSSDWNEVGSMNGSDWVVFLFKAVSDDVYNIETKEDEYVGINPVSSLRSLKTIKNLQWVIPALLERDVISIDVQYI